MATYFGMPYFGMPYYGNLFWHDKIWQLILARKMATYFGMPNYGNLFWHEKCPYRMARKIALFTVCQVSKWGQSTVNSPVIDEQLRNF